MSDPVKDLDAEHPVPTAWRPTIVAVVAAIARGDTSLHEGVDGVVPVTPDVSRFIDEYLEDYGETLLPLPEETWETSVVQWQGTHWDLLVDLWTEGEGRSDLVLTARVRESNGGFEYEITMVHVP